MEIPMTFPLDGDGFLRRECPSCNRQFKWLPTEKVTGSPHHYCCPYCAHRAAPSEWFTQQQAELIRASVLNAVGEELLKPLKRLKDINRPGSMLHITVSAPKPANVLRLVESDDGNRHVPTCHPTEPIKVLDEYAALGLVHCLVCGASASFPAPPNGQ